MSERPFSKRLIFSCSFFIGKSLRTVQKYETGEIEVSIDVVNEIAKHLDTTPTFILGYETNTAPIRSLADIMSFLFDLN